MAVHDLDTEKEQVAQGQGGSAGKGNGSDKTGEASYASGRSRRHRGEDGGNDQGLCEEPGPMLLMTTQQPAIHAALSR